ncbi:Ser/Thr protein kinase RdoA involved in Cpx stress response, MazF antagonist [Streptomyces sp. SceaMP-e96]|uniref:phosphotransferase family protein n=1 Tax=Streptomyces TaxID=1883 RepID=UPI000823EE62|nr:MULTISPECIES: phosphotransferase [unclassified Streptomyces]MYT17468.1 phosphotransferase [Streptomyces sp. SID4951]SCK42399.1 Ser/Thr protein kinase RdoA involved in Cpx stress response, MazF antagonist [Streptomyces sp. SceaMP-e96]
MTTTSLTPKGAAQRACAVWGLPARGISPLRSHATSVYLLPHVDAVVRVSRDEQRASIQRAIALTRWLVGQGLEVTEPLDVSQPLDVPGYVITLWRHYPQPDGPPPGPEHLGHLLSLLHRLPEPPIELPAYRPHLALRPVAESSTALTPSDREWILGRSDELLHAYAHLDFPLGQGLVHGDAYPGNTLWDGTAARLGDWDEAAIGPRETDLANTFQGVRFGRTTAQLRAFSDAYGYDLTDWPGLSVLTELRDLHTLGSFIRRADLGDLEAATQLAFRLDTLKRGDRTKSWAIH